MSASAPQCREREIWNPLRQAIAESSGFLAWKQALPKSDSDDTLSAERTDVLVHRYLEETLSTLAY